MNVARQSDQHWSAVTQVCRALHSHDLRLVDKVIASLPADEVTPVYHIVRTDIAERYNTPGLDKDARGYLLTLQEGLCDIVKSRVKLNQKLSHIESLEGYPKYQAMMVLLGKDPKSFHEWEKEKESLQSEER